MGLWTGDPRLAQAFALVGGCKRKQAGSRHRQKQPPFVFNNQAKLEQQQCGEAQTGAASVAVSQSFQSPMGISGCFDNVTAMRGARWVRVEIASHPQRTQSRICCSSLWPHVERKRQWYDGRKKALQSVGTKSAKRRLRQLSGRQRRSQRDVNHRISKKLIAKAERTKRAIGLEELTHIRTRARVKGPTQRARHSNWGFAQLRAFIAYKAKMAGVNVRVLGPAYTSQECYECGHTARANRRSQAQFYCVNCGHSALLTITRR